MLLNVKLDRPSRLSGKHDEDSDPSTDGLEMDGVSWSFARQSDGSARVTTTLRKAYVEVTLQDTYAYDASPLFALAPAIKDTIPEGI